ncbi:MAG: hypothetical protein ABI759_10050 [Candidatus Solibacter sp.]
MMQMDRLGKMMKTLSNILKKIQDTAREHDSPPPAPAGVVPR